MKPPVFKTGAFRKSKFLMSPVKDIKPWASINKVHEYAP